MCLIDYLVFKILNVTCCLLSAVVKTHKKHTKRYTELLLDYVSKIRCSKLDDLLAVVVLEAKV